LKCHCRAEKQVKREEKLIIKQLEKNKREEEKEKKRMDLEFQKEKRQTVCSSLSLSSLFFPCTNCYRMISASGATGTMLLGSLSYA
jgi:hypothetical protein